MLVNLTCCTHGVFFLHKVAFSRGFFLVELWGLLLWLSMHNSEDPGLFRSEISALAVYRPSDCPVEMHGFVLLDPTPGQISISGRYFRQQ